MEWLAASCSSFLLGFLPCLFLLKYLPVLLFGLGPLWLLGRCRSAVYCWMLRRSFIHSVLFTHQAVKFLLTCKADDDNRTCDSPLWILPCHHREQNMAIKHIYRYLTHFGSCLGRNQEDAEWKRNLLDKDALWVPCKDVHFQPNLKEWESRCTTCKDGLRT